MREENKSIAKEKKLRYDIIFIAAMLVISLLSVAVLLLTRKEGAEVVVSVGGEEIARYPLSENGEFSVNGGTNVFVIENGEVYMKSATCRGYQDCIEAGRIKYKNQSITCLPNGVELLIVGDAPDSDVELVS